MHCLVTGAAGFIGSNLVERLLSDGVWVTAVDNFDPYYPRAVKEANLADAFRDSRLRFVEADIRDTEALRRVKDRYDCIVHLAAKVGVRPSIAEPVEYEQVNVAGTQNLLEAAREWAVPQFVFASSSSVYGVNPKKPWSEDDHVLLPISPYAATKVSGELLGQSTRIYMESGFSASILYRLRTAAAAGCPGDRQVCRKYSSGSADSDIRRWLDQPRLYLRRRYRLRNPSRH